MDEEFVVLHTAVTFGLALMVWTACFCTFNLFGFTFILFPARTFS